MATVASGVASAIRAPPVQRQRVTFGRFVVGAAAGVLHGDHADDQPPCTGGVGIDTVDYTSVDLTIQLSLGARL